MADRPYPATAAADACPMCMKTGTLTCSGCKDIAYCSVKCQKRDWKFHKHLCKAFRDFRERPTADMRRVVCFPADGDKPIFEWMEIQDNGDFQDVSTDGTEFENGSYPMECALKVWTSQLLPKLIIFRYDDNFERNFKSVNSALSVATGNRTARTWKGPIVAYTGPTNEEGLMTEVEDFSMTQYSALMAWFVTWSPKTRAGLDVLYQDLLAPRVMAVNVVRGCGGSADTMESMEITGQHPTFAARLDSLSAVVHRSRGVAGEISPISERIKMPLTAWKPSTKEQDEAVIIPDIMMFSIESEQPVDLSTAIKYSYKKNDQQDMDNPITPMFITIDEDVASFGAIPPAWSKVDSDVLLNNCGDELLDLNIGTAAAFAAYCRYHVGPFVEWALATEEASRLPKIKRALKEVTPDKWATYQAQYQKLQDNSGKVSVDNVGKKRRMGLTKADAENVVARFLGV